jgi:cell division protein FtsX
LIKIQQRLLALFEHIRRPFVLRLIALLVSGLIALLLGGALLLIGHGASFTNLTQWSLSAVMSIAANNTSLW